MLMKEFKLSFSQFGSFNMLKEFCLWIWKIDYESKPCTIALWIGQVNFGGNGMCLNLGGNWKSFLINVVVILPLNSYKPQSLFMVNCVLFNMTFAPHHQSGDAHFSVQSNCLWPNTHSHPNLGAVVKLDHFFSHDQTLKVPLMFPPLHNENQFMTHH